MKRAFLAASYGTADTAGGEKAAESLSRLEQKLQACFADCSFYHACTSEAVRRRLAQAGRPRADVCGAVERMLADGIEELIVQPLYMIDGIANHKLQAEIACFQNCFATIKTGMPLLYDEADYVQAARVLIQVLQQETGSQDAVLLIGHGSSHAADASYDRLAYVMGRLWARDVFSGTLKTDLGRRQEMILKIRSKGFRRVIIQPLMLTVGKHVMEDMAGAGEFSWKQLLQREGFLAECRLAGLAELEGIHDIFLRHAQCAYSEG